MGILQSCVELSIKKILFPLQYTSLQWAWRASQITNLKIAHSTFYSGADQRKHQQLCVTGLCAGNSPVTGEFPAQRASNAENVSIWWRHHVYCIFYEGLVVLHRMFPRANFLRVPRNYQRFVFDAIPNMAEIIVFISWICIPCNLFNDNHLVKL